MPLPGWERVRLNSVFDRPKLTITSDGNIRYFEYENGKFEFLSEYKSADPQRGIAFLPKRGINTHENEVMRAFKTVNDSYVEPISFLVPRRAEVFQDDIFPPTVGLKPAMSAAEWFDGKENLPPKIDLASIYAGEEPTEVPSDYKPTAARAPSPKAPSPVKKAPEPEPESTASAPASALRDPPPSMNQQTASIKDLASKFTDDKDDSGDSDEEDSSSFEEIPKPIDRSEKHHSAAASAVPTEKSEPSAISRGLEGKPSPSPTKDNPNDIRPQQQQQQPQTSPASKSTINELSTASALADTSKSITSMKSSEQPMIQTSLAEIKDLLETQSRTMSVQSQEIRELTAEVGRLKVKLGE